ncbi:MAG: Crp/Fnr family transcriptional regulator [Actinomycetota bacterium]
MDGAELERRAGGGRRRLEAGATLFCQGDATFGLFAVVEGSVRLLRHGFDGGAITLHVARAGETFAEASLFSDVYHCDAVADGPALVAVIDKQAARALLATDTDFAMAFAARLARLVQGLRSQVELRDIRSAGDRIMAALSLRAGPDGSVRLAGSLKSFASEIGLTHEALYRALRRLEGRGALRREDGTLVINPCARAN